MATGFFDLNIPYESPSTFSAKHKTAKKLAAKAMELGFAGIAYNHSITSTISSNDSCSILLFSPSSFVAFDPLLASSIALRRDLLSIPRSSPFRQYTRLTFSFDNLSQASLVTGRNDIVSSYDIFAVQPLTQEALDYACETAEVDIISIDFWKQLQFRVNFRKAKAAIKRGVYFEIEYSSLITQKSNMLALSNIKLLIHWTRGKNLIISSAAPSLNEFRGPYDVANLLSLIGLSMEQAKASISRNCRNLIAKALRKKHFYKETIRAEPLLSNAKSALKESLAFNLSTWDPISSGEGDLRLDDMAQCISDTTAASKNVKAIDFSSLVDNDYSSGGIFLVGIKPNEVSVATTTPEKPGKARSKRKKHKTLVDPSNHVEERQNEDMGSNSIPILDDNSNDKDKSNSSVLSSPGKARRKRKSHHQSLLSSSKPSEEHGHEVVDANDIPVLDYDSNVKAQDSSSSFSPGTN